MIFLIIYVVFKYSLECIVRTMYGSSTIKSQNEVQLQCSTRREFLDKALEVREDKHIEAFRKWLAEAAEALVSDPQKFKQMKEQVDKIMEKKKIIGDRSEI